MRGKNTPNSLVRESIIDIMPQEGCFSRPQIRDLLLKEKGLVFGMDYSEGNISNALYVLSNSGFLIKLERGVYQKAPLKNGSSEFCDSIHTGTNPVSEGFPSYEMKEVLNLFKKEKNNLRKIYQELCSSLKSINLCTETTDEEFKKLKEVLDFKNAFEELLKKFGI
ncbi:MAG: hypothetical protein HFI31_07325 [Lachnospiraceae bacterium]|nr:hypothetical protein [Lachnospiraceae bacterium]